MSCTFFFLLWSLYFQYHISWYRFFGGLLKLWVGSSINPSKFSAVAFQILSLFLSVPWPPGYWLGIPGTLPLCLHDMEPLFHASHFCDSLNSILVIPSTEPLVFLQLCVKSICCFKFQILLFFLISRTPVWSLVIISCSLHLLLTLPFNIVGIIQLYSDKSRIWVPCRSVFALCCFCLISLMEPHFIYFFLNFYLFIFLPGSL